MIMTWPTELPRPERQSWQVQPQDARRHRQSDAGAPAYRRRFSSPARTVSLSLILSRGQKGVFDRFFHEDCAEGARLFRMPDPTTDGWRMHTADGAPLLTGDGRPLLLAAQWLCAWGDRPPVETVFGQVEFRKAFNVVVIP